MGALVARGNLVAADFGDAAVARATEVALQRFDWETVERIASSVSFLSTQDDIRAHREAAAADETGAIPMPRKRLDAVRDWFGSLHERRLPKITDPYAQQEQRRHQQMLEAHETTPPPDFTSSVEEVVAAAALACEAALNLDDVSKDMAADVLFTKYPETIDIAPRVAAELGMAATAGVQ